MPRPRNSVPAYRKHKQTGRAVVSIYRQDGSRTEVILPGKYGSALSTQEYELLLCQLRVHGGKLPSETSKRDITVAELILKFMAHAETYYVDPVTRETTARSWRARTPCVRSIGCTRTPPRQNSAPWLCNPCEAQ